MRNPMTCNGCMHNNSAFSNCCTVCKDGSMFRHRQKIRYGFDLDQCSAAKKALVDYSGTTVLPEIKNVIFNDSATIVFWADDTKTVVKAVNEEFDPEKGLAMAIAKKSPWKQG